MYTELKECLKDKRETGQNATSHLWTTVYYNVNNIDVYESIPFAADTRSCYQRTNRCVCKGICRHPERVETYSISNI